jgi:hypothetical protein
VLTRHVDDAETQKLIVPTTRPSRAGRDAGPGLSSCAATKLAAPVRGTFSKIRTGTTTVMTESSMKVGLKGQNPARVLLLSQETKPHP